jgi:hypothetical protein
LKLKLSLDVAETYARIASHLEKCGNLEAANGDSNFGRFLTKMTDVLERLKKLEARVGTDEELKEADTLSYFARESQAGKVCLSLECSFQLKCPYLRISCIVAFVVWPTTKQPTRTWSVRVARIETSRRFV